jgi:general nucleoside transport system permease protein
LPTPGYGEQAPEPQPNFVERYSLAQRAGGIAVPLLTALFAFFVGGLVVLVTTGKNPLTTYKEIFEGSGLNWFLPWETCADPCTPALNLQQTLLTWIPLVLTGLAVAFAFRCGLFNIGGQGQYLAGSILAVAIGAELSGLNPAAHILLAIGGAVLAGAAIAGIAGILKATVGAHEVISTIMLNWIVIWVGSYLFGVGGPLQSDVEESLPVSNDIAEGAKLPVFWGDPLLQGLHIGLFVALAGLVVYWIVLNRTTLGYGVKAVGFNPEAARYGGISVARSYFLAMAIAGGFAGVAGALDVLGWKFRLDLTDIQSSTIGFVGIAVALLGRNTAIGVFFAGLLFAALITGTSTRNLDPEVFQPELASNLTLLIQGLIVLFVGADVLVLWLLSRVRRRSA